MIATTLRRAALLVGAVVLVPVATAAASDYLYYSGTGGGGVASVRVAQFDGFIGRVNTDGTGNTTSFIPTTVGGGNIAATTSRLYWSQPSTFLGGASIDGTGASTTWLDVPGNLTPAVAVNSSHVFFGWGPIGGPRSIGRARLDGSGNEPAFIQLPAVDDGWSIASNDSHIYWVAARGTSIGRVGVDGSGMEPNFIRGLTAGSSVALTATHLYWIDDLGSTSAIGRASLDGSSVTHSLVGGLADGGIGLTVTGTRIFWGNAGPSLVPSSSARIAPANSSIGVANIDGTGVNEAFLTGLPPAIYGVAAAPPVLSASLAGAGSGSVRSTPAGIDCGSACAAAFAFAQGVSLGATASTGSVFTGWSGACSGASATCALTMNESQAVTATFYRTSDLKPSVLPSRRRLTSGQSMRIGIRVRNAASTVAPSVTSCLRLPSGFAVTRARGSIRSGRTLCFRLGDVAAGSQVTRTIRVRAAATRRVVRVIDGSGRVVGGSRVNARAVRVVVRPRAVRARVTG